jgi:hypothetical protein
MLNKVEELTKFMDKINLNAIKMEKYCFGVLLPSHKVDNVDVYEFIEHLYSVVSLCDTMLEEFKELYEELHDECESFKKEFHHYIDPVDYSTPILIKHITYDNTLFNLKADLNNSAKTLSDTKLIEETTKLLTLVGQIRNNLWLVTNYVSNVKKLKNMERSVVKGIS